jgi:hypothetical protein
MAVTHGRCKVVAVMLSNLKRPRIGHFRSKTATWIKKWFKISAGTSREPQDTWGIGRDTWETGGLTGDPRDTRTRGWGIGGKGGGSERAAGPEGPNSLAQ